MKLYEILGDMKERTVRFCVLVLLMICGKGMVCARQLTVDEAIARMRREMGRRETRGEVGRREARGEVQYLVRYTEMKDGMATVYVVSTEGEGTYVLSGDDCAPAVLGWLDDELPDTIPAALKWWVGQYSEGIADAVKAEQTISVASVHAAVEPLLATTWRQDAPYNNMCNDVATGCQTGCVATAMAQIMKYYNYPKQGTGQNSYTVSNVTVSSDFAEHSYEWDKMLNSYNYWGNGDEAEAAVALLMRDCGVALEMNYGTYASSAANSMVAYALMTYFGYDKAMENKYRGRMSDAEWEEVIINELEACRPVFYSGASNGSGGHAFVCDGYDGNGYFHFNWGWGGGCDGYFLITGAGALNPYRNSKADDCYNNGQMITIGIQPDCGGKKKSGTIEFLLPYTVNATTVYRSGSFYLSDTYAINRSMSPMNVMFGVMFKNGDDVYYANSYYSNGVYDLKSSYMPSLMVYASGVPKNGVYEVYPVYKDMDEYAPQWRQVLYPDDQVVPTVEVLGTEPDVYLSAQPYAYSHGQRTPTNKVAADDVNVHFELSVQNDFDNMSVICYIRTKSSNSTIARSIKTYSAKAGDKIIVDCQPQQYGYASYTVGDEYKIMIYYNGSLINTTPITVVDHLPTIVDVSQKVGESLNGNASIADIDQLVNDILNTQTISLP